jgi:hypothetical protein
MTHGKIIPRTPTTKYGSLFRWNHHIPPSRAHDDSKQKGDIHINVVFTNQKATNKRFNKFKKCKKIKKIHNLITYVSLVFIMYQFIYKPRVKSIKMLIFFENSSIHIYLPLFVFTITDSMKTKTCVNTHTIKKH